MNTLDRERALRLGAHRNLRETWPHDICASTTFTLTSGTLQGAPIPLLAGEKYDHAYIGVGATGATWGSNNDGHWYIAVYDPYGNLVQQTADQGHTGLAAFTPYLVALNSAITPAADGLYTAVIMCYLGTGGSPVAPALRSLATFQTGNLLTDTPKETTSSNAGQTSGTAPASLGSNSGTSSKLWIALYS